MMLLAKMFHTKSLFLSSFGLCLVVLLVQSCANTLRTNPQDSVVAYGCDVSFPMQHENVSTNYPWLPHNVDPSIPTPPEYKGMPIQHLGDRQTFYNEFLQGCVDFFNAQPAHAYDVFSIKGGRCRYSEIDRVNLCLTQPRSMQVSEWFCEMCFSNVRTMKPCCQTDKFPTSPFSTASSELHQRWIQKN